MRFITLFLLFMVSTAFAELEDAENSDDAEYQDYQEFRKVVTEGFIQVTDQFGTELRLSAMLIACDNRKLAQRISPTPEAISTSLLNMRDLIPKNISLLIYLAAVQTSVNTYGVGVMESVKNSMKAINNSTKVCEIAITDARALLE